MTNLVVVAYCIYLPIVIVLTGWVAHNLFKNGKVFMLDIFKGKEDIAVSTNKLLEMGFYLINLGFAFVFMTVMYEVSNTKALFETLSYKIGWFVLYLGIMLFFNLYLFFRGRRKSRENLNTKISNAINVAH